VFRGLNNQSQMELEKRSLNHRITAKRFSATAHSVKSPEVRKS
jgi:hypothetical protein